MCALVTLRVAGHTIRLELNDPAIAARCGAFVAPADAVPEATFAIDDERLAQAMAEYRADSREELRFACLATEFYLWLLARDAFCLHASAVCRDGRAYLFCAASGVGKSTHAAQWLRAFGDAACVLDGDKPVLARSGSGWTASGTPWCGKEGCGLPRTAPLQGVCVLRRGPANAIERLTPAEALPALFEQTPKPSDAQGMERLLGLLDALLRQTPVYRLTCTPTPAAAELAYERMRPIPSDAEEIP